MDPEKQIKKQLNAHAKRVFGKPLAQCTPDEIRQEWSEGFDFEIPEDMYDEDRAAFALGVARILEDLGVPVADRTVFLSPAFDRTDGEPTTLNVRFEQTLSDLYVLVDGKRVAHRGKPGTKLAGTWVSMDLDYQIRDLDDQKIEVLKGGVRLH